MSVSDRALQSTNRKKHEDLCKLFENEMRRFLAHGETLRQIKELCVYKETHKTFEAFVQDRFGIDRTYAHRLIDAAEVNQNLLPIGNKIELPTNEAQFREVAKAPPEKQAEVVKKAAEKAAEENRKPTAKDYKKVVGELLLEGEGPVVEAPAPTATPAASHHPKEMAGPLMAHVKTLVQMLNDLKKRKDQRGGEWIDVQAISTQISALKYSLKSSIYYADCPACGGKGCEKCKQTGFLPELKSAVVDEAKK